jgi:glycosyltransferase involved in cell wall biosynthesis
LSVIVPAFNAAATIGEQLEAFMAQAWAGDWDVVVADNGSTDETAKIVERFAVAERFSPPGPTLVRTRIESCVPARRRRLRISPRNHDAQAA